MIVKVDCSEIPNLRLEKECNTKYIPKLFKPNLTRPKSLYDMVSDKLRSQEYRRII